MRRMYSEQELTKIIGEVFDAKIEAGAFDDSISDAVDAYLVEHPVDITALEGKTIAPAVVNATTSISAPAGTFTSLNGESNPSVKPLYWHGISIDDSSYKAFLQMTIIDNTPSAYDIAALKTWMKNIASSSGANGLCVSCNGNLYNFADDESNQHSGNIVALVMFPADVATETLRVVSIPSGFQKESFTTTLTDFFAYFEYLVDRYNKLN